MAHDQYYTELHCCFFNDTVNSTVFWYFNLEGFNFFPRFLFVCLFCKKNVILSRERKATIRLIRESDFESFNFETLNLNTV